MSAPRHHPEDDLLIGYASGRLRPIKSLLVATHLAYCPECRTRVGAFEEQCGAWFEALPAMADDGLDALLGRLDGMLDTVPAEAPPPPPVPAALSDGGHPPVPEPLRSWLARPMDDCTWQTIAPGVSVSTWAEEGAGSKVCLLRMAANAPVPAHRHTALEMLLVLRGGFADHDGAYRLGDVATYAPDTDHHARADDDGECICLFLLDGDIVFLD